MYNVLYLHCHDAGRWLSPYGHPVRTPALDALAGRSLLFRQAHCANPTCSPSRASLLTGQWAHQQMLGLAHRGFSLKEPRHHLANFLKGHGYHTALCGIQHEFGSSREGWPYLEEHYPERDRPPSRSADADVAEKAVRFLQGASGSQPFFLSVGFFYPHRTFPSGRKLSDPSLPVPDIYPEDERIRGDLADYHAAVHEMDAAAGRVLDALEKQGLADNTIVLFTTDHGPAFPHMKCTLHDAGTGVALMLRTPGLPGGVATDALVSQVDVFPTLCDLLGLEPPDWLEGVSLRPVLEDPAARVRDHLFAEVNFHAAYEPKRAVRTRRHKLIVNADPEHDTPPMANIDAGPTKTVLLERGLAGATRPPVELYDLKEDPLERRNLAGDPAHAAVQAQLAAMLADWQCRTDDPLLAGPLELPEGAYVNTHEQLDPSPKPA